MTQQNRTPGMGTAIESVENEFRLGQNIWYLLKGIQIVSTAVDSGSTPTTTLRPGLCMGQIFSTKLYREYVPTNTDGSQHCHGAILRGVELLNRISGSTENCPAQLVVGGYIDGSKLYGIDSVARSQMKGRFVFGDDLGGGYWPFRQEKAKTANYTVGTDSSALLESGTLYTNTGDGDPINFTLPALAAGLSYTFLAVADFSLTVTSAAGNDMITSNDVAASSVAFSTGGDIIGGMVRVSCNAAGTKWIVEKLSANAMTIT